MKYRIRCGDRYYCGMAYKDGQAFQKWEEKSPFSFPLEMNLNDAMCTLETLLETGKFTETPRIEKVKEENNEWLLPFFDGIYYCPRTGLDHCVSDGRCKDFADCPVREQEETNG